MKFYHCDWVMHFDMIREGGPVPAERAIITILFFFFEGISLSII